MQSKSSFYSEKMGTKEEWGDPQANFQNRHNLSNLMVNDLIWWGMWILVLSILTSLYFFVSIFWIILNHYTILNNLKN